MNRPIVIPTINSTMDKPRGVLRKDLGNDTDVMAVLINKWGNCFPGPKASRQKVDLQRWLTL